MAYREILARCEIRILALGFDLMSPHISKINVIKTK